MRDDGDVSTAALRRLPPEALAGVREAFAAEVAERLPRLRAAVEAAEPAGLPDAVRDAHALGSSAAVVGEPVASRAARTAEALLCEDGDADARLRAARPAVSDLARCLSGWAP